MDLQDRALLLNPDEVQALLDAVAQQHVTHAIGGMQHCDRAVCRLAASVSRDDFVSEDDMEERLDDATQQGEDVGYDRGYDDGHDVGLIEGRAHALREHECPQVAEQPHEVSFETGAYDNGFAAGYRLGYQEAQADKLDATQ